MNILHIREKLVRGGIEILLFNIFKNSHGLSDKFYLLTFDDGLMDDEFAEAGINIIKLKRRRRIDFRLIKNLKKIIIEKKINVIHSHQAVEGLHSFLATRRLNVKNVISHHGSIYPFKDKFIMKLLIKNIDANIAVSNSYLKKLKEEEKFNIAKNFHVIYNGIDPDIFNCLSTNLKDELNIPKKSLLLGMIGNFYNSIRDQFTICQALPKLFDRFDNLHFVFVGGWTAENPKYYNSCYQFCMDNKILNRVHFIGSRIDVGSILNEIDIFVYSSNRDTFGIAVVEAMISGTPVVVNDIPPMLEITNDGESAEIFKSKDKKSLLFAIEKLVADVEHRESLAMKGKIWASKEFTITKHIIELQKLYKKLIF